MRPQSTKRRTSALATLLLPLAAAVAAQPTSFQATSTTVDLDMVAAGGRPLVEVRAGDTVGKMILDTGAASTLLLRSFVDAAGARVLGPARVNSPLGSAGLEAVAVEIDDLTVAGHRVGPVTATAIADDAFPLPGGALGVLPVGLLYRNRVVEIDLSAGTLTLSDRPTRPITGWTKRDEDDWLLSTTVEIGALTVDAHIDTGHSGGLVLPDRYARELGLEDQLTPAGAIRTIDAERTLRRAAYEGTIAVAGLRLPIDELLFADVPVANLGAAPLSGQVLVWDRGGERFALRASSTPPVPRTRTHTATPPRLGLMARPATDSIDVVDTEPGSRAQRAGLRAGDRIVAVDGRPLTEIPPPDRGRLLAAARTLTVEREGAEVEIPLPSS